MRIMLSIKPEYANRILDGSKRFEFRKRVHINRRVTTVVIYATLPVGKVIGEFTVGDIRAGRPEQLWEQTCTHSGVSKEFFERYFDGRETGYAIEVKSARRYKRPRPVGEFLASGVPPQSYAYLHGGPVARPKSRQRTARPAHAAPSQNPHGRTATSSR